MWSSLNCYFLQPSKCFCILRRCKYQSFSNDFWRLSSSLLNVVDWTIYLHVGRRHLQYMPKILNTIRALLRFCCFWLVYPYSSWLLHCHWANCTLTTMLMMKPWRILVNGSLWTDKLAEPNQSITNNLFIWLDVLLMTKQRATSKYDIDGLVQDSSFSIANAMEILQSCTNPSMWAITRCNISHRICP